MCNLSSAIEREGIEKGRRFLQNKNRVNFYTSFAESSCYSLPCCGRFHDEMKLWDRTFRCSCGTEMDRDVHAARNMVWLYENNVGVGRTDLKRVEMVALVNSVLKTESANFNL